MQKQKYSLIIIIAILVSVHLSQNKHCCAQVKCNTSYLEYEQLTQDKHKASAMRVGHDLFQSLASKYPENAGLHDLQKRLEAAYNLVELITQSLESRRKKILVDISDLDILPELPPVRVDEEESAHLLPSAEHLYFTNLPSFSHKLRIQEVPATEAKFLSKYYDLRMQSWIEKVVDITARASVTASESSALSHYSFVLPLLYLSEDNSAWNEPDFLLPIIGIDNLDTMSDFCLLRVERPRTALAIAKYKAKSEGSSFSLLDWSLAASGRCVENNRPDIAEKLLSAAIDSLSDNDKVAELRLKIAENYGKCGDDVRAAKLCAQIAKDFPNNSLYGKVMCSYFAYLTRQSKAQEILAEIDSALESQQCQRHLSQLMYLKWWALRKTDQQHLANQIGEQLISNYAENPCVAPVLLAQATDALSNQRYDRCRKLLVQLTKNFPQTNSAKQAEKILTRLDKK